MEKNKTIQNLMNSFAGESQAVQRYTLYAKRARKEGWSNIAAIFEETASNEHYHAKEFYQHLIEIVGEDNIPETSGVTAEYPIAIKGTYDNLLFAAAGEADEVIEYNKFSEEAAAEGYNVLANKFKLIANVEARHSLRYKKMANLLKIEQVISKDEEVEWKCMKCGHVHKGRRAPGVCPICNHESGYFEKYELNI